MLGLLVPAVTLAWRPAASLPTRPTLSSPTLPLQTVTLACRRTTPLLAAEGPLPSDETAPDEPDAASAEPAATPPTPAPDTKTVVMEGPFGKDSPIWKTPKYETTGKEDNVPGFLKTALDFLWVPLVLVAILAQGREMSGNPMELNQYARGERAPALELEAPESTPPPAS